MKNRILYGSIVLLFLINAFQLYWQFQTDKRLPPRPREVIITELNLTDNQVLRYDQLIQKHQRDLRAIDGDLLHSKTALYNKVLVQGSTINDTAFLAINQVYQRLEKAHVDHFLRLKEILTKSQKKKYDALVPKLAHFFRPKPPRKR
jgi:hypothetical protein